MAGKNTGAYDAATGTAVGGFAWNDRNAKAYAEGRGGYVTNQHLSGSEASVAWIAGDAGKAVSGDQHETDVA